MTRCFLANPISRFQQSVSQALLYNKCKMALMSEFLKQVQNFSCTYYFLFRWAFDVVTNSKVIFKGNWAIVINIGADFKAPNCIALLQNLAHCAPRIGWPEFEQKLFWLAAKLDFSKSSQFRPVFEVEMQRTAKISARRVLFEFSRPFINSDIFKFRNLSVAQFTFIEMFLIAFDEIFC